MQVLVHGSIWLLCNIFTYHFSQLLHKVAGSKLVYVPFTYLVITYVKIRTYTSYKVQYVPYVPLSYGFLT
jgi:hypothetical protein